MPGWEVQLKVGNKAGKSKLMSKLDQYIKYYVTQVMSSFDF